VSSRYESFNASFDHLHLEAFENDGQIASVGHHSQLVSSVSVSISILVEHYVNHAFVSEYFLNL
jgi:hypothetical protein